MKFPAFLETLLSDYFRWVAIAFSVLVLVLGYFFILDEKISTIRTSGLLERANVEAELEREQKFLEELQASISKFTLVLSDEELQQIDSFLPTGPDFPGLLLTLDSLARSANLELEDMSINEVGFVLGNGNETSTNPDQTGDPPAAQAATPISPNLRTQDVTVRVSGGTNYDSFKRFIDLVEQSQRLLDVVSLSFSHSVSESGESSSTRPYNVVVRTYYLPESSS